MSRLLVVANICFIFGVIFWTVGYPFLHELFVYKSQQYTYEFVLNKQNEKRFAELPEEKRELIQKQFHFLKEEMNKSFIHKFRVALQLLFQELPPLERAWITFSLIISILFLAGYPGTKQASWLLPVLVAFYAADNYMHGIHPINLDKDLFPSEEVILVEKLPSGIQQQKQVLLKGWQNYLVREWAKNSPSDDYQAQLEEGEFAFHVARIERMGKVHINYPQAFAKRESPIFLLLYISWNILLATSITVTVSSRAQSPQNSRQEQEKKFA